MSSAGVMAARLRMLTWRRRWPALGAAGAVWLAGASGVALLPDQYSSSARLYVDSGAVLTPLLRGLALDSTAASDVDILQRTLLSRPNLEKVLSRTRLGYRADTPEEREVLIKRLPLSVHIQPQTRNLFTIEYSDRSPLLARDVVQTLLNLFVESALAGSRDDTVTARRFLERQIVAYEAKLRAAEQARAAFQVKYAELLPDEAGVSRLDAARQRAGDLAGQVDDTLLRRDVMTRELAQTPPTYAAESLAGVPASRAATPLEEARRALTLLRLRLTDKHPDVVAAQAVVETLAKPGATPRAAEPVLPPGRPVPNPVYEQIRLRLIDAQSALESVRRQAMRATVDAGRLGVKTHEAPGVAAEFVNLNRDYDVTRKTYDELLVRRESMRVGEAADEEADKVKLRIIDAPQVPMVSSGPQRMILNVGMFLLGTGAAVGVVLLFHMLDGAFYGLADLRTLGLPVWGGVSANPAPRRSRVFAATRFGLAALMLASVPAGVASVPHLQDRLRGLAAAHWPGLAL